LRPVSSPVGDDIPVEGQYMFERTNQGE
jgi:hypothetical protein